MEYSIIKMFSFSYVSIFFLQFSNIQSDEKSGGAGGVSGFPLAGQPPVGVSNSTHSQNNIYFINVEILGSTLLHNFKFTR